MPKKTQAKCTALPDKQTYYYQVAIPYGADVHRFDVECDECAHLGDKVIFIKDSREVSVFRNFLYLIYLGDKEKYEEIKKSPTVPPTFGLADGKTL